MDKFARTTSIEVGVGSTFKIAPPCSVAVPNEKTRRPLTKTYHEPEFLLQALICYILKPDYYTGSTDKAVEVASEAARIAAVVLSTSPMDTFDLAVQLQHLIPCFFGIGHMQRAASHILTAYNQVAIDLADKPIQEVIRHKAALLGLLATLPARSLYVLDIVTSAATDIYEEYMVEDELREQITEELQEFLGPRVAGVTQAVLLPYLVQFEALLTRCFRREDEYESMNSAGDAHLWITLAEDHRRLATLIRVMFGVVSKQANKSAPESASTAATKLGPVTSKTLTNMNQRGVQTSAAWFNLDSHSGRLPFYNHSQRAHRLFMGLPYTPSPDYYTLHPDQEIFDGVSVKTPDICAILLMIMQKCLSDNNVRSPVPLVEIWTNYCLFNTGPPSRLENKFPAIVMAALATSKALMVRAHEQKKCPLYTFMYQDFNKQEYGRAFPEYVQGLSTLSATVLPESRFMPYCHLVHETVKIAWVDHSTDQPGEYDFTKKGKDSECFGVGTSTTVSGFDLLERVLNDVGLRKLCHVPTPNDGAIFEAALKKFRAEERIRAEKPQNESDDEPPTITDIIIADLATTTISEMDKVRALRKALALNSKRVIAAYIHPLESHSLVTTTTKPKKRKSAKDSAAREEDEDSEVTEFKYIKNLQWYIEFAFPDKKDQDRFVEILVSDTINDMPKELNEPLTRVTEFKELTKIKLFVPASVEECPATPQGVLNARGLYARRLDKTIKWYHECDPAEQEKIPTFSSNPKGQEWVDTLASLLQDQRWAKPEKDRFYSLEDLLRLVVTSP